jgi:3-methyl-2-oxobutanoate hydroxymethyltransferase
VLVLQDLLGIYTGSASKNPSEFKNPRFVRNFLQDSAVDGKASIQAAVTAYVQAVKNKTFPAAEHSY